MTQRRRKLQDQVRASAACPVRLEGRQAEGRLPAWTHLDGRFAQGAFNKTTHKARLASNSPRDWVAR
jgi:hypothetical protein